MISVEQVAILAVAAGFLLSAVMGYNSRGRRGAQNVFQLLFMAVLVGIVMTVVPLVIYEQCEKATSLCRPTTDTYGWALVFPFLLIPLYALTALASHWIGLVLAR